MASLAEREKALLPCYRGEMLLLKYLELRGNEPPSLQNVADEFDLFVSPLNEGLQRPKRRVFRYIEVLSRQHFAEIVINGDQQFVAITAVGLMSAQGIGLDPLLELNWRNNMQENIKNSSLQRQ